MSRTYFMREEEAFGLKDLEEIRQLKEDVIDALSSYLEGYYRGGFSKHAIMGPVGKLLSAVASSKIESVEALIGYILNIHEKATGYAVQQEYREHLENGIRLLMELKRKTPKRLFTKELREIDYGVYYRRMKCIAEKIAKKKGGESNE